MPLLAIGLLVLAAIAVRMLLPSVVSARLGRALFWLCNAVAATLVVVIGATALRGMSQLGIGMVFLPLYVGLGAAFVLLGLLLQHILASGKMAATVTERP